MAQLFVPFPRPSFLSSTMNYPSSSTAYPPLGDLSLNVFDSPEKCWPQSIHNSHLLSHPVHSHDPRYTSGECQYRWSVPAWQSLDSLPYISAPCLNSKFETSSPLDNLLPPYAESDTDILFPHTVMPELEFPPSPSGTSSSLSTDISTPPSPNPLPLHVVCNAPLVAPIPLPYHSPTFLQFELPDIDEDLSHPPYIRRGGKRKREAAEDLDNNLSSKRRPLNPHWSSSTHLRHSGHISIRGKHARPLPYHAQR